MSRTKEFLADVEDQFATWYAENANTLSCAKVKGDPQGWESAADGFANAVARRAYRAGFVAGVDRGLFKASDPAALRRLGNAIIPPAEPQDEFEASIER